MIGGGYRDCTGHVRFRRTWLGRLILQVEVRRHRDFAMGGDCKLWVDAREADISDARKSRLRHGLEPIL